MVRSVCCSDPGLHCGQQYERRGTQDGGDGWDLGREPKEAALEPQACPIGHLAAPTEPPVGPTLSLPLGSSYPSGMQLTLKKPLPTAANLSKPAQEQVPPLRMGAHFPLWQQRQLF